MNYILHVEIIRIANCKVSSEILEELVNEEFKNMGTVRPGSLLLPDAFSSSILKENITSVKIDEISKLQNNKQVTDDSENLSVNKVRFQFYTYHLEEEEIQNEKLTVGDGENETVAASNYCLLPHVAFNDIWENLIYDDNIKENLLDYSRTSVIFSQHKINANVICWNKVVLLYGPPGTGKTSLCKGLAQKLSIRLRKYYKLAEFIEINSHSLFSKYYSESGKLVMRMFLKIKEHLDYGESLVFVLIDEIESLIHARNACMTGSEPSDSIRVVNAILTQLDQIRKYPNVLILTTSNLKQAIDLAFIDRADLQIFVGPPSVNAIYDIFISCFKELMKGKIIDCEDVSFSSFKLSLESAEEKKFIEPSAYLAIVAKSCEGMSGRILRKIPFLAYSFYLRNEEKTIFDYIKAIEVAIEYYQLSKKSSCFATDS